MCRDAFPRRPKLCSIFGTARRAIPTDVDYRAKKPQSPSRRLLTRRLGRRRSLVRCSGVFDTAFGGEISCETSEPVSAFVMLACYRRQSGLTMRIGRGLQRGTPWIV